MKPGSTPSLRVLAIGFSFFVALFSLAQNAHAANTIGGFVFDRGRNPIADIDVELLDEYYRVVNNGTTNGRTKTSSSGRYEFGGLNDGNYTVRVFAFRYDLEDSSQPVQATSISSIPGQAGSMYYSADFYLQPKQGGLREAELAVIFAQDVPKAAQQAYKKAINDLSKNRADEGFVGLQEALTLFPKYFAAWMRYGQELFAKKQYTAATQAYMSAAEVNPKSAMAYYNAGVALNILGGKYVKNAKVALDEAVKLAPASPSVLLELGKAERKLGMLKEAEAHLLKAKKLSPTRVPDIQKELAQLYANDLKKYKEAADELEQYVKAAKLSDEDQAKLKKQIADFKTKAQSPAPTAN